MANIAKTDTQQVVASEVTDSLLKDYLNAMGLAKDLTPQETAQFLQIAKAYQLNPFKREIYASKYGGQMSIIVGYEVYLKRAERTGLLSGWNCTVEGDVKDGSLRAVCTIYRKDREHPFVWEAWYDECVQTTKDGIPTKFWKKARFMTKKVCISQAFRLAFPDELGGMPYTSEEINTQDVPHEVVQEPKSESQQPAQPAKDTGWKATELQVREYNAHFGTGLFSEDEQAKYAFSPKWSEKQFKAAFNAVQKMYLERKEAAKEAQKNG